MNVTRFQTEVGEVVGIELGCSDFDGESTIRYSNSCSPGCSDGIKLFVTPSLRSSTIHAKVCAGRYEFVTKLSKEWWARVAGKVLGWDDSKIREQVDAEWARKVQNANIRSNWKPGSSTSARRTGPACVMCGARVPKGDELCASCLGGKSDKLVDAGSLEDLDL